MDSAEVLSICGSSAAASTQIGHLPRGSDSTPLMDEERKATIEWYEATEQRLPAQAIGMLSRTVLAAE